MAEPVFWKSKSHPLSLALLPVSYLYAGLEALNRKVTHAQHPGKPVICVGNLTAGGAGKTPSVQWLIEWLTQENKAPAVLSRGFGGSLKGPIKVDPKHHSAAQVGDEPLMLAETCAVYICADRHQSLRLAAQDGHAVMVKDDGFQNPSMTHHFNLIVIDGATGIGNGRLLPAGPLRQPLSIALKNLDALLVIGEPSHASLAPVVKSVEAMGKAIFKGEIKPQSPKPKKSTARVHAFCGIAKPEKFIASLQGHGYEVAQISNFGDHHAFTEAEAERLLASDLRLITTQKDMARLQGAAKGSALARLAETASPLPIALHIPEAETLRMAIEAALEKKQANQLYKSY
ncbi:MAG: tetraacyldisaccharide 4'-kinase [Rhodobiaceae bacterium]|nr:tetraacyldisaccharide 4'-kinase [Rhodobiaceae bacterium]